jgi:predicted Zn-dependent protease
MRSMRAFLALLAVAALAFGALRLGDVRACERAQERPASSASALLEHCAGALPLARASAALLRAGRPAEAQRLAEAAARRQPDDYVGWVALAGVRAARGDAAGAQRARARARALNPRAVALQRR